MHAIDASLQRLGTDYVDLYQIHRFDYATPMEETLQALNDVVKAGKALYIGASSMFAWQFAKYLHLARSEGWTRFVTMQNHYNLLYREEEREMIPLCQSERVGLIPGARWRAACWRVTGRRGPTRARTDEFAQIDVHQNPGGGRTRGRPRGQLAERHGVPPARIALAWLLHKPAVTAPIVGAWKPHHLEDAVAALDIKLSAEDIAALEEPYVPHPVLGHS